MFPNFIKLLMVGWWALLELKCNLHQNYFMRSVQICCHFSSLELLMLDWTVKVELASKLFFENGSNLLSLFLTSTIDVGVDS